MNDKEKLLMDYARMCVQTRCGDCPLWVLRKRGTACSQCIIDHKDEAIKAIKKWGAEHPVKTRQDLFLEQYPDSTPNRICPKFVDKINCGLQYFDGEIYMCDLCRRDYWSQEVDHE